jgi:hypothetical protein|tara:strand:+ start:565 stop:738 length:174 start_codon:yes stop_codon:yes gene_type:complete
VSNFFDWDTAKVTVASFTGLSNWYIETIDIWLKCGISLASLIYIILKIKELVANKGK